jgi:flagellar basal body-associated protein FliL
MAKEKLEDMSLDKLRKRKKISVVLLWVMIGVVILNIATLLFIFIKGKQLNYSVLGSTFPCLFFALYFYAGIKKINGEISRRKSQ